MSLANAPLACFLNLITTVASSRARNCITRRIETAKASATLFANDSLIVIHVNLSVKVSVTS